MSSKASKTASPPPHANGYVAPKTGIFRLIPAPLVPYAELMRLDRPAGFYAFYWHYAIGVAFAACIAPAAPSPGEVFALAGYLALWVLVFRGVVCTWNDNIDQELDRQVARCRVRPIARGAVSTTQGHVFTIAQGIVCAAMLYQFSTAVWTYAAIMTIVLIIYPFGKRITDFPQVILGFGFAIPVFMCSAALNTDPVLQSDPSRPEAMKLQTLGAICLYFAGNLWTIIFDTIYAHQDIKDDIKAGVKSLAVRLGDKTKLGCAVLSAIQIGLLIICGYLCDLDWPFYLLSCGGTALSLTAMLSIVDLSKPSSCAWWFGPGSRLVGASVVSGLLSHYTLRIR